MTHGAPCVTVKYAFTKPQLNTIGNVMKNTLEHIVNAHFPLITDRFNYKQGSIIGFATGYQKATCSVLLAIRLKDIHLCTSINNKTDYIEKYTEYITKVYYNYKDNTNFNQLV